MEHAIDLSNQANVDVFTKPPYGFIKVAHVELDNDLFPHSHRKAGMKCRKTEIKFVSSVPTLWAEKREWVYMIVFDNKVVKIGGTHTGLKARAGSYLCGTKEYRDKGTCATTNFIIYQAAKFAIESGISVEIYGKPLEKTTVVVESFGETIEVVPQTYHHHETNMLEIYKRLTGTYPPLSRNSGNGEVQTNHLR